MTETATQTSAAETEYSGHELDAFMGKMVGDIKAPRVVIADGAKFKGNIEMGVD